MSFTVSGEKAKENGKTPKIEHNEKKSTSIIKYSQTEYSLFSQKPLTAVDSLVLSQLSYINMEKVVPVLGEGKEPVILQSLFRAELMDEYMSGIFYKPQQTKALLTAVCCSPRFRDIKVTDFVRSDDNRQEKQFSAVTFILPTGEIYIAFRGTDDSLNGWKEDFNMSFMNTIPGQISALNYLRIIAEKTDGRIYIGGHSKGGNLAMYAASFAPVYIQERIAQVFNHDGPGLTKESRKRSDYTDISGKTNTTLPHESIFGLLFSDGNYNVVASRRMGLMQHDTFRWEILNGDFIYEKEVKAGSNKLVDSLHELREVLDEKDIQLFVDTVFDIIYSAGATTLSEFPRMAISQRDKILQTMKNLPPENSELLKSVTMEMIKIVRSKTFSLPEREADILTDTINKINDTTDKIGRRVYDTAEKISDAKDRITDKISETAEKVSDFIQSRKDKG